MLRLFISLTTVGFFLASVAGQESNQPKCKLTVDKSPNIRGVKLGMTASELLAIFPDANNPQNKMQLEQGAGWPRFGYAVVSVNPSDEQKSSGVEYFLMDLFDKRVVSFAVHYRGG